jgi:hypothetical protein
VTIEELRALVTAAKAASTISWQGVILQEETTGRLKQLNDNYDATLLLYDLATEQLAKQAPNTTSALLLLSGAKFIEAQRGGEQSALNALVSLTIYTEAPFHGTSFGAGQANAVKV